MESFVTTILISFTLALCVSPLIIKLMRKLKCNQNVYEYVEKHKKKQGTPTMGGIIFIFSTIVSSFCVVQGNFTLAIVCLVTMFAFGLLGFFDDFIKIYFKRNLGLRAYQKIIGQVAISTIVCVFCYVSDLVPTNIYLPFTTASINLGWFYIPFTIFVMLAITNSVNLTDGLDGLASGTSLVYLVSFSLVLFILLKSQPGSDIALSVFLEQQNILVVCGACIGGLLAYLIHNCFPALIFMGDTGSLALGGLIGAVGITTGQVLLIPILGAVFVATCVSVVVQVFWYKLTKRRILKMAPLHHHFELKGCNENKIVSIYIIVSIIIGLVGILLTLLL